MRRVGAFVLIAALLLLAACDTGPGMDLRLFADNFNRASRGRARLDITQFTVEESEDGAMYTAFVGHGELITAKALPSGRIHTVSLTGLPDAYHQDFFVAAMSVLAAFAGVEGDHAERMLQEVYVGTLPLLGIHSVEREGFRLSYAGNEAGRYFRLSCLRHLPPAIELPTLREPILEEAGIRDQESGNASNQN